MSRQAALVALEAAWRRCREEPEFVRELRGCLATHAGRPTPLTHADQLAGRLGGDLRIYLKREDLIHTGTHEFNACLGQAFLARRMGKTRLVTGTGAGSHGVAAASSAALLGLSCVIYLSGESERSQEPSLARMRLMGAEVVPLAGSRTAEEADRAAERDWAGSLDDTYYLPGRGLAEPPHASIVRDLQAVIGHEARSQFLEAEGRMPDSLVDRAEKRGDPIGLFQAFLDDREVRMFAVGAADRSPAAAPDGAGARASSRVTQARVGDEEAVAASRLLAATEGILPALEAARALAFVARQGPSGEIGRVILVGLSGRGDQDVARTVWEDARVDREPRQG